MRYSNWAKIIDKDSEYYGQVFEVRTILFTTKEVMGYFKASLTSFKFDQIQFCVTKDNEPVKIGEEYVCIGDLLEESKGKEGGEIIDFIEFQKDIRLKYKRKDNSEELTDLSLEEENIKPLHPTNKIKITAEGKEYWVSREEFSRLSK
jgi:hypothetical protein